MSEPLRDAGATIAKGSSTSLERTSGSDRSEKTGNESSIGDTLPAVTGRPNAYVADALTEVSIEPRSGARIGLVGSPVTPLLHVSALEQAVQPQPSAPTPTGLAGRSRPWPERGSVVDLFCGIGGLSHGFVLEGFNVKAGVDVDPSCKYAYETNNRAKFHERDVAGLTGEWINSLFIPNRPRVLVGCAPCQPFSSYTRLSRPGNPTAKWRLLEQFGRIVREAQPDIVSMENVARLATFQGGQLFRDFLACLAGYRVWSGIVECADYGVPQTRKRLVVLGSRLGDMRLADATHSADQYRTVGQTIGHLPRIQAGAACSEDALHQASRLSTRNRKRIRAAKPGGTWRDWADQTLVSNCHRRHSGRFYNNVYGRMSWDAPAPTITTQCYGFGNGRFGHPDQDRAISLREAALLQTFPAHYEFQKPANQPPSGAPPVGSATLSQWN